MEQSKREHARDTSGRWRIPGYILVPVVVGGGFGLAAFYQYLQESKVSPQEAQDAIYAEYGECFANTSYALGRTATEYTNDVAKVIPDTLADDVLVYDVWLGLSGKVLVEADKATALRLANMSCETQKSLGQIANGG